MRIPVSVNTECADNSMGIHIATKQCRLKENNTGAPNKITATIIRQECLGDDQFDLK